jgi:Lipid-droplet associated hydrolase
LQAPPAIYSALTMAHDEMETVRDLDVHFLRELAHRDLWLYYAEVDDWVGGQREAVLRALRDTPAESRVVRSRSSRSSRDDSIPHAFCIGAPALSHAPLRVFLTFSG